MAPARSSGFVSRSDTLTLGCHRYEFFKNDYRLVASRRPTKRNRHRDGFVEFSRCRSGTIIRLIISPHVERNVLVAQSGMKTWRVISFSKRRSPKLLVFYDIPNISFIVPFLSSFNQYPPFFLTRTTRACITSTDERKREENHVGHQIIMSGLARLLFPAETCQRRRT